MTDSKKTFQSTINDLNFFLYTEDWYDVIEMDFLDRFTLYEVLMDDEESNFVSRLSAQNEALHLLEVVKFIYN